MDIDFNGLEVNRIIMHTIKEKSLLQDSATAEFDRELLEVNDDVLGVITQRLIDAAGKQSRAFNLEFDLTKVGYGSFYSFCNGLRDKSDEDFINISCNIADLLAGSQTKINIPGGFLILLDCISEDKPLYIVIKAEPHQALQKLPGQSGLSFLKSVFLSPSQKLYKIGIMYEKEEIINDEPNGTYDCFLFDDQFRTVGEPAEYFYKDFLGFYIGNNAKIQSQKFYDKTEDFIIEKVEDTDTKTALLQTLRNEFLINQIPTLTPSEFARTYFHTPALRDEYIAEVAPNIATTFVKDVILIKNRLNKRKIEFQNGINLNGPNDNFDENVHFIKNRNDFDRLTEGDDNFTIIKIKGQPYSG